MNRITFPLKLQMRRTQVADLNQALVLLGLLITDADKDSQYFGKSTQEAVRRFQEEHQLSVTGVVDEATARALNKLLAERGALNEEIIYKVEGLVRKHDGKPAIALKVQVFDRDVTREELLGSTITDREGFYRITFSAGQYNRTGAERGGPEVFIRVYGMAGETLSQSKTVQDAPPELNLDLTLPATPAIPVKSLVVKGRVSFSNGQAVDNGVIKAFDRNVGEDDTLLGQAATDGRGNYSIFYTLDQLGAKSAADMVIVLYQNEKLLQTSDVIFNAGTEVAINFIIPAVVAPEFQRIKGKIQPLLRNNIKIGGLAQAQVKFLSQKTGIDAQKIDRLTQSHALADNDQTLTLFYYGTLSQNLPTDPGALLARPQEDIRSALEQAATLNQIPRLQPQEIDDILNTTLPILRAKKLLEPAPIGQRASLGDLLNTIPVELALPDEVKKEVADVVATNGVDFKQLSIQLQAAGFQDQIPKVERTLRLADVTRNHPPLMKYFQQINFSDPEDVSLKSLTALSRDQWLDLAYTHGVPAGTDQTPEAYARQMEMTIDALHPTAMLAARFNSGDLVIRPPGFEKAKAFFNNHPDFDILYTNIPVYAAQKKFIGVDNKEEKDTLVKSLLRLQRVKRLSTVWDEAGAMLNTRLDSAPDLVGAGPSRVAQRLSGQVTPERISRIYERARQVHDISLTLMSGLLPRFSPTPIPGLPDSNRLPDLRKLNHDYPTLQNLFGPLDTAACDYDQSVLSPAAYFVDLLQFLNPKGEDQLRNPSHLKVLLERRPDLVDLELSSANTEIELPYIDLVIEILENAIALPKKLDLPPGTNGTAVLQALSEEITGPLQKTSLGIIGPGLTSAPEEDEQRQLINGEGATWIVKDQQRRWTLENFQGTPVIFNFGVQLKFNLLTPVSLVPFPNTYAAQLISELDNNRISDEIKEQIEALIHNEFEDLKYLFIISLSVTPIYSGAEWLLSLRLGVKVKFEPINSDRVNLILQTPSGDKTVKTRYCQPALAQEVSAGLDNGQIVFPLTQFLRPDFKYVISKNTDDSWLIFLDEICTVHYRPDQMIIKSLAYQTVGQSRDLIACPENQNPLAYEKLCLANFPWTLPFNLPWETVRVCLERAGVSRRELMERINPENYLNDSNWAYETLGISTDEADLIVTNKGGERSDPLVILGVDSRPRRRLGQV